MLENMSISVVGCSYVAGTVNIGGGGLFAGCTRAPEQRLVWAIAQWCELRAKGEALM